MPKPRSSPIERQLTAYEEGWRQDHEEAIRFWDFQENLSVGIAIYQTIAQRSSSWRQRVSLGIEPFRPEDEQEVRNLYVWWLNSCQHALSRLEHFEREFGAIDGAAQFRLCCEQANKAVATWVPPALSKAVGLHAAEFSQQEAGRLTAALESGEARLRMRPRPIE